jgi:hypothetical protein
MTDFILSQDGLKDRGRPFIIVCEGFGDVCFVAALLLKKNLMLYDVGCPTKKGGFGEGKESIPKYLQALAAVKKGLRGILLLVDADNKPNEAFASMVAGLQSAEFPIPDEAFKISGNDFRVAIYLLPGPARSGTLENLLLEAVFDLKPKLEQCVEDFSNCTESVKGWSPNHQAKMKLSALVAASCERNPWCSISLVWSQEDNPIPIGSNRFDHLAGFLADFAV